MNTQTQKQMHTDLPWKVMPCPDHAGKHPFHDHRWIATADAHVERGHDPRSWGLETGTLICEMRDGPPANAALIVRAVNSHGAMVDSLTETRLALIAAVDLCERAGVKYVIRPEWLEAASKARAALKLATEGSR